MLVKVDVITDAHIFIGVGWESDTNLETWESDAGRRAGKYGGVDGREDKYGDNVVDRQTGGIIVELLATKTQNLDIICEEWNKDISE